MRGFPSGSDGKEFAYNAGDLSSIPESGRSPGEGNSNPLQCSCLENSIDRGAWQATAHCVEKRQTWMATNIHTWANYSSAGKESTCSAGYTRNPSLTPGSGRSPEEGNGNHSSTLTWPIPWTEEPDWLQFLGSQRAGHNWATKHSTTHEIIKESEFGLRENYTFKKMLFEILITSWKRHVETGHSLMEFYYFLFFSEVFLELAVYNVTAFPGMLPNGKIRWWEERGRAGLHSSEQDGTFLFYQNSLSSLGTDTQCSKLNSQLP